MIQFDETTIINPAWIVGIKHLNKISSPPIGHFNSARANEPKVVITTGVPHHEYVICVNDLYPKGREFIESYGLQL